MLMTYSQDIYPLEYVPTVFDNFVTNIVVYGKTIRLGLWDTAGQEEYTRLRMVSYSMTVSKVSFFIFSCLQALETKVSLRTLHLKVYVCVY